MKNIGKMSYFGVAPPSQTIVYKNKASCQSFCMSIYGSNSGNSPFADFRKWSIWFTVMVVNRALLKAQAMGILVACVTMNRKVKKKIN